MGSQELIIASTTPEEYKKFDSRSMKPIYFTEIDGSANAVVELLEYVKSDNFKKKVEYIPPNPISLQLAIVDRCIKQAKEINVVNKFKEYDEKMLMKEKVYENSKVIYDQIMLIQEAIVFGYTALETFANLSIPSDYKYSFKNSKGIVETYDKKAIERWVSLDDKLSEILIEIYGTKSIKTKNLWNEFIIFEGYRHEIIHQKSIDYTSFYRKYFKNNIYKYLKVPRLLIGFYRDEASKIGRNNPLWPWMGDEGDKIPTRYGAKKLFSQSEITGNLFEEKTKYKKS